MRSSSIFEFERLYKVNIPVIEEFDYYINLLEMSQEYSYIPEAMSQVEDLEKILLKETTIKEYKLSCLDILVEYIKNTNAYKSFQEFSLAALPKFEGKDQRVFEFTENKNSNYYVSIDLRSANYSVMKCLFDKENELFKDWNELCVAKNIHSAISQSKSFRQYVFGNLNPKRNQTIQQSIVMEMINKIVDRLNLSFDEDIVYITHDEIILSFDRVLHYNKSNVLYQLNNALDTKVPVRYTFFTVEAIEDLKKMYIKNILNLNDGSEYKTLFGIPGKQFFYFFKKYILNLPLESRDLLFKDDNKIAMWVVNSKNKIASSTNEIMNYQSYE